jgi:hypothetical protein
MFIVTMSTLEAPRGVRAHFAGLVILVTAQCYKHSVPTGLI